jgi:hypothetical protein
MYQRALQGYEKVLGMDNIITCIPVSDKVPEDTVLVFSVR